MSGYLPATISYCTRCGAEVESGSQFCGSCGQALALSRPPSYVSVTQPMPPMAYPQSSGGFGNLFSASGRVGRLEYFLTIVVATITGVFGFALVTLTTGPTIGFLLGLGLWFVAALVSLLAGIKRLHDFDQSGWLILLGFVPFVSLILLLIMLFKGPSPGLNRFGYAGSGSPF